MWISNAGFAEIFIVFGRIENDKNITAFILEFDKNNPNGVTLGEEENKLGITSSSTSCDANPFEQIISRSTFISPIERVIDTPSLEASYFWHSIPKRIEIPACIAFW